MDTKPLLRSLVPADLAELVTDAGLPSYRATQLTDWLFGHGAMEWEAMSNLPRSLRQDLGNRYRSCWPGPVGTAGFPGRYP